MFDKKDDSLIDKDPDYINCAKYKFSLNEMLKKHPDGVKSSRLIAKALLTTEENVEKMYASVVKKLKRVLVNK